MKFVVLADTHIPVRTDGLPAAVLKAAEAADGVIHAGDFTDAGTLAALEKLPRFVGVVGNMDDTGVRGRLRDFELLEVEDVRIGITHGWGPPDPLPAMLRRHLDEERLDVIVYGHSHRPFNERIEGVLLFNPGSPTDTKSAPYLSYGVLTVESGEVSGEIIRLAPAPCVRQR